MPPRTIYVRPRHEGIWQAAEQAAEERDISLSALITAALAQYLDLPLTGREGHGSNEGAGDDQRD